jgi:predicted metal-dependent hydrolase
MRRSTRARRSRITITGDGEVVVVLPMRAPTHEADELVKRHTAWIARHVSKITARRRALATRPSLAFGRILSVAGQAEIVRATTSKECAALERRLRRAARAALIERLEARSVEMGLRYGRVTVRDQRTRWGSASRTGTLSFSWRLILAPPDVLDYVVVHELAHLRWAGHGKRFWALVATKFPAHVAPRRWLREHEYEIRHALD